MGGLKNNLLEIVYPDILALFHFNSDRNAFKIVFFSQAIFNISQIAFLNQVRIITEKNEGRRLDFGLSAVEKFNILPLYGGRKLFLDRKSVV